jgi:hypothetical protein
MACGSRRRRLDCFQPRQKVSYPFAGNLGDQATQRRMLLFTGRKFPYMGQDVPFCASIRRHYCTHRSDREAIHFRSITREQIQAHPYSMTADIELTRGKAERHEFQRMRFKEFRHSGDCKGGRLTASDGGVLIQSLARFHTSTFREIISASLSRVIAAERRAFAR